jgi:nucleotide-binding universal stress UspA family protein
MATTPFRCILVPHDFSDTADRALTEAAALARLTGGRLRVLHVIAPPAVPVDVPLPDPFDLVPAHRAALERRVRDVLGAKAPETSVTVEVGVPVDRILEAAEHADSIVMGTLGRTGLTHFLLGSVAERVVRSSPIPVLTIRAEDEARTRRSGKPKRAA